MKIEIPKNEKIQKTRSFNCPEGNFRGRLFEAKTVQDRDSTDGKIRLLFETDVPGMNQFQMMTRKDFPPDLKAGSPLRRFMEQWLGKEFINNQDEVDFDQLKGAEADLSVVHFHNEGHTNPYCDIKAYPPGKLTLTSQPDGSGNSNQAGPAKHSNSIMPFSGACGRDYAQFASLLKQLIQPMQQELALSAKNI